MAWLSNRPAGARGAARAVAVRALAMAAALASAPGVAADERAAPGGDVIVGTVLVTCAALREAAPDERIAACTALIDKLRDGGDPKALAFAHVARARAKVAKQAYQDALDDLDEPIALDPAHETSYTARGEVHVRLGQLDRALADFDKTLELHPDLAAALNDRCFTRALIGKDLDAALADCNAAFAAAPVYAEALDSRCLVYFRMGKDDNAIADCTAALVAKPKLAPPLYVRGLAKRRKGDTAGADADIAAARALDPNVADLYTRFGVAP